MLRRRPVCLLCLMIVCVLGILGAAGIPLLPVPPGMVKVEKAVDSGDSIVVFGTVEGCETQDGYTYCILRDASLVFSSDSSFSFSYLKSKSFLKKLNSGRCGERIDKVRLSFLDARHYSAGVRLLVRGKAEQGAPATNLGQFDQGNYDRLLRIGCRMKRPEVLLVTGEEDVFREGMIVLRSQMRKRIADVYPKDLAGVASCMLLGDKSLLMDDTRALWQLGGISHMLAISGLHLTVLGMGLYGLLKRLRLGNVMSGIFSMGALGVYTVFTGCSVSTLRALLMFCVLMMGRILGRTYDPPTACALAAILILLENPYYLMQASFQLSFCAVVIVNLFQKRSSFTMSYMLYLGMLPLVLINFSEIPLYSIPLNLCVVPLLPAMLGLCMLGMAGGVHLHGALAFPSIVLLTGVEKILRAVGRLPFSSLILGKPKLFQVAGFYCLLVVFACLMKRDRLYKKRFLYFLMVPAMILVLGFKLHTSLKVTAIDVGQGDGICVEIPGGQTMLVDSGSSTTMNVGTYRVVPFLKAEGIRRVDYLVATHMDSDHISGLEELLTMIASRETAIRVGTVVLPRLREKGDAYKSMEGLARAAGARILYVTNGDFLLFPKVRVDVLNPNYDKQISPVDENAECVVLSLTYRKFDMLLTGDVENEGEKHLISYLQKHPKRYEVLKVAHHGSKNSTPMELLKIIKPTVSIISSGKGNRYGHPNKELLERLKDIHTKVFRTDQGGAVTIISDGRRYSVTSYR